MEASQARNMDFTQAPGLTCGLMQESIEIPAILC